VSRTIRRARPRFYKSAKRHVRDGAPQYHTAGCRNHGSCDYCTNNRTHSSRRRAPIEE